VPQCRGERVCKVEGRTTRKAEYRPELLGGSKGRGAAVEDSTGEFKWAGKECEECGQRADSLGRPCVPSESWQAGSPGGRVEASSWLCYRPEREGGGL
jgi:hypothetical protein